MTARADGDVVVFRVHLVSASVPRRSSHNLLSLGSFHLEEEVDRMEVVVGVVVVAVVSLLLIVS